MDETKDIEEMRRDFLEAIQKACDKLRVETSVVQPPVQITECPPLLIGVDLAQEESFSAPVYFSIEDNENKP